MRLLLALALTTFSVSCEKASHSGDADVPVKTEPAAQVEELPEVAKPLEPGVFGPTLAALETPDSYTAEFHLQDASCTSCHADIAQEWGDSVHALASLSNPFYRFSFDVFVAESGAEKTPFCAGCHDPALLFDGAIQKDIDGLSPAAHAGVGCVHCHSMDSYTGDGNGSYTLNTSPIPLPKDGDAASLKAHMVRLGGAKMKANEHCASCHRGFMGPHSGHDVIISGLDEWGPFRRSAYNGNTTTRIAEVAPQDCVSCHMPRTNGYASHRFAGGHSTLAAMTGSEKQIDAVQKMVENAALLDITFVGLDPAKPDAALGDVLAAEHVFFDVVIHNDKVGHAFPGGAQDIRDTWLEMEIIDSQGKIVSELGKNHAETGADPGAYVLQAYMVDDQGSRNREHAVHGFRTPAYRHSITPKDSSLVRYAWKVPPGTNLTNLRVRARLNHRRLTLSFQQATCEHTKRQQDKAFQEGALKHRGMSLDPCVAQPISPIATVERAITEHTQTWRGHALRGQALQHHVQENLGEALAAYQHALRLIEQDTNATNGQRASLHLEQGKILGNLGRSQEAFDQFGFAEKRIGEHPAIHFARGTTLQRVFKTKEAAEWFQKAAALQEDDRIWRGLATAHGSAQNMVDSLLAAQKGLAIEPRDPDLLRNQMVAFRALKKDSDDAKIATDIFGQFQHDTLAPHIHNKCADRDPECKQGRLPIEVKVLP